MVNQQKQALLISWMLISSVILFALAIPYIISADRVLFLSGIVKTHHHFHERCFLCGMTRAFMSILKGSLHEAYNYSRYSIVLFTVFIANQLLVIVFTINQIYKHQRRK